MLFSLSKKIKKNINEIPIYITIKIKDPNSVALLLLLLSLEIKNIKINSDLPNYQTEALLECFKKDYSLSKVPEIKKGNQNQSKRA